MKQLVTIINVLLVLSSALSCTERGTGEDYEFIEAELKHEIGQCNEELEACTESLMFTYSECSRLPYSCRRVELLEHKDSLLLRLHLLECQQSEYKSVEAEFSRWRKMYREKCSMAEDSICTVVFGNDPEQNLEYYEQQADLLYNKEVWLINHLRSY